MIANFFICFITVALTYVELIKIIFLFHQDEPRKLQVVINPVEADKVPQTASVDEIKKITGTLSLSSPSTMVSFPFFHNPLMGNLLFKSKNKNAFPDKMRFFPNNPSKFFFISIFPWGTFILVYTYMIVYFSFCFSFQRKSLSSSSGKLMICC